MALLSPWPPVTSVVAREAAIARLKAVVAGRAASSDEEANHLGMVASAEVEAYAPDAPQAIKDEAVIRLAGYFAGADFGGVAKEDIGPRNVTYSTNQAGAFYRCGAAGLLSRWRVRSAGVVG